MGVTYKTVFWKIKMMNLLIQRKINAFYILFSVITVIVVVLKLILLIMKNIKLMMIMILIH